MNLHSRILRSIHQECRLESLPQVGYIYQHLGLLNNPADLWGHVAHSNEIIAMIVGARARPIMKLASSRSHIYCCSLSASISSPIVVDTFFFLIVVPFKRLARAIANRLLPSPYQLRHRARNVFKTTWQWPSPDRLSKQAGRFLMTRIPSHGRPW